MGVGVLVGAASGCYSDPHCGYRKGDESCAKRTPERPYCDLCQFEEMGCVAQPVTERECMLVPESGPPPAMTTTAADPTETSG